MSSVPLRLHVDFLSLEGGALVEREQLEEELYLQPAPVQAERLEQNEQHDDHPVDRALQSVGGGNGGDFALNVRNRRLARAERGGQPRDDAGQVVLQIGQERIDHDQEDRAEHRAVQAEGAADQDHDDELDRELQREHFRADEGELVREQHTGQSGNRRTDRKRLHLVERDVDAHAARRRFAVADRDKGAPRRRAQEIERADDGEDQYAEAEEVEGRSVLRHRLPEQAQGLDPHALVAVGHAFPAGQHFLDDEGKGNRRNDEIDAGQPQRRKSDQRTDHASQQTAGQEVDRKGNVVLLQIGGRIGADRQKGGVAERGLTGEAGEDHQAYAHGGVDADKHQLADQIARQHERRDHEKRQQDTVGNDVAAVRKQPDVVFVIGLEEEPHQTFFRV